MNENRLSQVLNTLRTKAKAAIIATVAGTAVTTGGYLWYSPKTITSTEAAAHAGQRVKQEIVVGSSLKSKNHALLNEGEFPKHTMTVRVTPDHPAFANIPAGKDVLKGRRVIATGTMSSYKDKPQLVVGKGDTFEIK